ncbi:DUF5655 domain-containing protein [Glaciecola petra]|uniref:DUF5655 domain-containing protein n=1 Tax=Glaciecola petra TaxID=3075602 RepID=A0ABU2ZTU8_9ALTE|nr:DUF5655 domain-containing protein [Aestuariibacter sp. P117]MDT0596067.1 DUF5655 domain-containing protein [Aestuariibacter sp. P117]
MDQALKTMIANMPEKTGKNLDEWKELLKQQAIEKHSVAVKFLKEQHGVSHGFANTIVTLSKQNTDSAEDLVSAQYKGKEALLPLYDALISTLKSFGEDVLITPKKTSVSVIRKHQFVLIKPATKTRIDLGLKLKDVEPQGILEPSGPFGTMCTHRIQLKTVSDINAELNDWLLKAYNKSV